MQRIIKSKRKSNFYIMSHIARNDSSISFKAFGLLSYLMGLPEDWEIHVSHLVKVKKEGREAVYAAIKELINAGYMKRIDVRDEDNKFVRVDYLVSDEKIFTSQPEELADEKDYDIPESGKAVYGKAVNGLPVYGKADYIYNIEDTNKEDTNTVDLKVDGAPEGDNPVDKPSENKQEVNTPVAPKKDKYADQTISIIEELNTVTGRNFRQTDANMKHIRARLREGFTPDDFNAVITFKNAQWSARADMKAYLRPETLFGAKFDAYLQEARQAQAARPVVEEGASGAYANYLKYAAKYSALGAGALLTQSEHHNLTEGEALSLYRRTFTKHELTALFHKAHEEAQEAVRRGQAVRVADVFKRLTNEASRPK